MLERKKYSWEEERESESLTTVDNVAWKLSLRQAYLSRDLTEVGK
jgi:hypothetical protein